MVFKFLLSVFVILMACQPLCAESYKWLNKIGLAKAMLEKTRLNHSPNAMAYIEIRRIAPPNRNAERKPRSIVIKHRDYAWKEIGLALMEVESGDIEIIKIRKEGTKLINSSSKFRVEIVSRVSGLTWNGKNTSYLITLKYGTTHAESNWVVIANKWIRSPRLVRGKPQKTNPHEEIYTPYSKELDNDELLAAGSRHLKADVHYALFRLGSLGVGSLVFQNQTVSSVVKPDFFKMIALAEHTDPQEFYEFRAGSLEFNPFERVLVILGANGGESFQSSNFAGAVGLMQFTNNSSARRKTIGTWDMVRRVYSSVNLPEFKLGSLGHVESIMAAVLLRDYNLNELVKVFGRDILEDKKLDSYLYAAHNCGIGRVIQALKRGAKDWRVALRKLSKTDETIIYLEKIDYLNDN